MGETGDETYPIKGGKEVSKNSAPIRTALEFEDGYITIPEPMNVFGAQEATATCNARARHERNDRDAIKREHTAWFSWSILDKERKVVWLTVLRLTSRRRFGMNVQSGSGWSKVFIHARNSPSTG